MELEIKMCVEALREGLKQGVKLESILYLDTDVRIVDILKDILIANDEEDQFKIIISKLNS